MHREYKREHMHLGDVQDLTSKMQPDGSLRWTAPAGKWAIVRFGYSLLGITNHPASPEGTGLEVDKLSRAAVQSHMNSYLDLYAQLLEPSLLGRRGLRAMVNDSYEAGAQNWTDDLPDQFLRRRGYDLHPWLPAMTGRILVSAEATDHFLWDFRRTLQELMTENHYDQIAESLHARHMLHYGESREQGRQIFVDGIDAKRATDVPMGAMWTPGPVATQEMADADLRESASVAHIYGQNLVATESMTALGLPGNAYAFAPEELWTANSRTG
jgi:(4-O-methyl)-D-glucuronate---lignin esterase